MIRINLLPPELKVKETQKIVLPDIPVKKTLIIAVGSIIAAQLLLSAVAFALVMYSGVIKAQTAALKSELGDVTKLKSETTSAQNKLNEIKTLTDKKIYWASVLNSITESVTKGIWLRSLSLDEAVQGEATKGSKLDKKKKPAPKAEEKTADKKTDKNAKGSKKGKDVAKKEEPKKIVKRLKLEGTVYAPGQETAFIGKFVKALKDDMYFKENFSEIELVSTNQKKIGNFDVFDFVLVCQFNEGKV